MFAAIVALLIVAVLRWSGVRGRFGLRIASRFVRGSVRDCGSDGSTGASVVAGAWS
jgi:hypothetical protein